MTKAEIIAQLAKDRKVEEYVRNVAHSGTRLTPDLQDLSQQVYLILLEYDEEKLVRLYENGSLGFFIARIIANQYLSKTSPFYRLFRKFRSLSEDLNPKASDDK